MLAPPKDFRLLRSSSGEFPEKERFAAWRALLADWILSLETRRATSDPFHAHVFLRALPDLRFGWGTVGAALNKRTREIVARDNDDFVLMMNLEGTFLASRDGRELELAPGDAYLMSCAEVGKFDRPTNGKLLAIRVKRDAIAPLVHDIHDRVARLIPRGTEGLQLLAGYIRLLDNGEPLTTETGRALVTGHVHDLVALALGAKREAHEMASGRGLPAARLKAIKYYLDKNHSRQELSVDEAARRFRVSPRSVQRLFEVDGTTFSEFLLARRLAHAHELLKDIRRRRQSIGEIAHECGFGEISYFNRTFRARYGAAPSDVRHHEAFRELGAK